MYAYKSSVWTKTPMLHLYLHLLICGSHKSASSSTSRQPPVSTMPDCSTHPLPCWRWWPACSSPPTPPPWPRHVPLQRAGTAAFLTNLARSSWRAAPASGGAGRTRGLNAQGGRGARRCSVGPRKAARGEPAASAPQRWPGRRGGAPFVAARGAIERGN